MLSRSDTRRNARGFLERYGVTIAGIVIFLYYLGATLDLFLYPHARRDFLGYFFQFSSVVLLWGLVCLAARILEYRRKQREEQEKNRALLQEYERRKMQLEVLDEMSDLLNDTVNNPLAVISLSASSIRERFEPDSEMLNYLDSIDSALKRVREVLADFKSYHATKIVHSIQSIPAREPGAQQQRSVSVDPTGAIRPT